MASGRHGRPRNELEGPEEVIGTLREMWEEAATAHRMMERMEQRDEENLEGHNGGVEVDLKYLNFAEFLMANSLSFRGMYNPDRADEWVKAVEKIFTVLAYTKEQKVAFATYMLEADVEFWWWAPRGCWKVLKPTSPGRFSSHTFMRSIFLHL